MTLITANHMPVDVMVMIVMMGVNPDVGSFGFAEKREVLRVIGDGLG